ncbi:MAG: phenylalanyl-tRNA synthetase, beta subunit [Planctomycetota bacterium]|nr:phenylalanyl-tRNA synthetase, beta subunit [Planctomycetota bacterium]
MIVSWNWLSQYVRLDMPVDVLTERLALTGLNHESTEEVGGDLAIDLEVTSNRPDCLGHLGVAREVSVLFGNELKIPDPRPKTSGAAVETFTSVTIEDRALCPQFTARVVSGATVKESPWWMRKRLETLGVRPISNIVDVTNYVMFECGQPLHAYDLDTLAGKRLVVRRARPGETLVAINGKTYELSPEMLAIADAERPVGLAGVMGGLDTEIGPKTKNVLIEAARFDAMTTRRTGRALGLTSAAGYRFERPIDPERTEWASRRAAELILETAGGVLHPGVIDLGAPVPPRPPIMLRLDQIPRVLGIKIDHETVARILLALGLKPAGETFTSLAFRPPSWRSDLEREIDLIEEVARIHGYEHIPEDRPVPLARSSKARRERVETEVRSALTGMGFDEACTFSLVSTPDWEIQPSGDPVPPLRVEHSTRKREVTLRRSLSPSLLLARGYNEAHGNPNAEFFEIANVYLPRSGAPLPDEPARLAIVSGRDFLGLKGVIEAMLRRLHLTGKLEARPSTHALFTPGRQADLTYDGRHFGTLGEVEPAQFDAHGLRSACSAAELSFNVLLDDAELIPQYRPTASFPAVERDLSLVVEQSLPWSELAEAARQTAGSSLESLTFLDTFAGGNLPPGQHSLHFGMTFRHPARTLTGEEVELAVQQVIDACAARFGASLRT